MNVRRDRGQKTGQVFGWGFIYTLVQRRPLGRIDRAANFQFYINSPNRNYGRILRHYFLFCFQLYYIFFVKFNTNDFSVFTYDAVKFLFLFGVYVRKIILCVGENIYENIYLYFNNIYFISNPFCMWRWFNTK